MPRLTGLTTSIAACNHSFIMAQATITITLRVTPELYDALSKDSRTQGKSFNQALCDALQDWLLSDAKSNKSANPDPIRA